MLIRKDNIFIDQRVTFFFAGRPKSNYLISYTYFQSFPPSCPSNPLRTFNSNRESKTAIN